MSIMRRYGPDDKGVTVPVNLRKLKRVGARPPFVDYLVQLWDRRQFIFFDARARVQSANNSDRLGSLWMVLTPILNGLTYFFIFGILLGTGRGIDNFIGYLIVGVFMFQMTAQSVMQGARSLTSNKKVIQGFKFPRAALPIAENLRELISCIPTLIVMMLIVLSVPPVEPISVRWLLVLPIVALQFIFNLGISLVLAPIVLRFNDVANLMSFVTRLWMYASGVFYSLDQFSNYSALVSVLQVNPLYCVLDMSRDVLLYSTTPDWRTWAILMLWSFGSLVIGFFMFWRKEESYGRTN